MAENETVERTGNTIVAIMVIAVLIGVLVLSIAIVFNALTVAQNNINGLVINTTSVINETGWANQTGYPLSYSTTTGFFNPVITALYNRTSGLSVALANVSVSATGVVTNATSRVYTNLSISYTWQKDISNSTGVNLGYSNIKDDILSMVTNFFDLAPTVGTILAVVLLIAGIVVLVLYVRRMKDNGSNSEGTFQG